MKQVAIGTIAKFINGYSFKPTDWSETGTPIIRIQNLTDTSKPFNRTGLRVPEKYIVRKGDTLVSWSATINVFDWDKDENAYLNQHIFKVNFDHDQVDKEYFKHLLKHTIDDLTKLSHGATMKHVVKGDFENHKIPLPNLKTQRQIAHLLSRAEELIAVRQRSLNLLNDLLKSTFLDLFGDPVKNEKGWELRSLKSTSRKLSDGPFGSNLKSSHYAEEGVRVIRLQNIGVGEFVDTDVKYVDKNHYDNLLYKYTCHAGDIVIATMGRPNLRACIIPHYVGKAINKADCLVMIPNEELVKSEYIVYLLNSEGAQHLMSTLLHGQTRTRVSLGQLSTVTIPVPPFPLQTRFAEIVNHVEGLKTQKRESLTQLKHLYQSLLQQAFAGELDGSGVVLPKPNVSLTEAYYVPKPPKIRRGSDKQSALKTKLMSVARRTATEITIQPILSESASVMKLLKLTLYDSFRSLPADFTISFLPDNTSADQLSFSPYCLVGPNGSGKSNVLEVLAAIFYHIDCIYLTSKPNGFEKDEEQPERGFDATVCQPDAFELTYLTRVPSLATSERPNPLWHITISKAIGNRPIIRGYERRENRLDELPPRELNRTEVTQVLPELVVGYSSGENEVLSLPFFKMRFLHYDEYLDRLSNQFDYAKPEGRLVYLDNQFSEAVLLANYLIQPPGVMQPVYDIIGIERVTSFKLTIRQNQYVPLQAIIGKLRSYPEQFQAIASSSMSKTATLTSLLGQSVIDKLSQCATSRTETTETLNDLSGTYSVLRLDFQITATVQQEFRRMFNNDPLTLFRAFQILFTLNLCTVDDITKRAVYDTSSLYISEMIPTSPNNQRIATFEDVIIQKREEDGFHHKIPIKALSDGEYQFLHSMGICLLLKDTNALFLLDEPETHFNPDWRARFISTLNQCLQANESRESIGELLITSHSPFIVSDCRPNNVLIFKRGQNSPDRPSFNTFGASVDNISMNVFEKRETIANEANLMLKDWRSEPVESQGDIDRLRVNARQLGDSIEKIMFLNYLREKEKTLPATSDK